MCVCFCCFFILFFFLGGGGGGGGGRVGRGVVGGMAVPTRGYCSCRQMEISA